MKGHPLNILILGASGLIGSAVATATRANGHTVTGLARSQTAAAQLHNAGITPLLGDIRSPEPWINAILTHDAIIQCAATWDDDMGDVDHALTQHIIEKARSRSTPLRVLYTGGCWLYGATGDHVATEATPRIGFAPFNWMLNSSTQLLAAPHLSTAILHPAMVYNGPNGATARYHANAIANQPIEIWGSSNTLWPLIHTSDLGRAYAHVLAHPDETGHFNISAETGVPAHVIATKVARDAGSTKPHIIRSAASVLQDHGPQSGGPMLDQRMAAPRLNELGWHPKQSFT